MANVPGGKMVKWTPSEAKKYEDLKMEAIEARIEGDMPTAIAKAREMREFLSEVRMKKAQMHARRKCARKKPCKGVIRVHVESKEEVGKIGTDLLKRSKNYLGG